MSEVALQRENDQLDARIRSDRQAKKDTILVEVKLGGMAASAL